MAYYTQGQGLMSQRRGSSFYFYHYDGLGSTKALTDANQNSQASYSYDAWGNILQTNGTIINPYLYVGELGYYADGDSGMYLLTQRWYNPLVGRFVARDPAKESYLYNYGGNNPIIFIDPGGEKVQVIGCGENTQRVKWEIDFLCNTIIPKSIKDTCCHGSGWDKWRNKLKECCANAKIWCHSQSYLYCRGSICGWSRPFQKHKCEAHICENGLHPSLCGPIGSTIAHEWTHTLAGFHFWKPELEPGYVELCLFRAYRHNYPYGDTNWYYILSY